MKKVLFIFVAVLGFVFVLNANAADTKKVAATTTTKEFKWTDAAKMKMHMETHVKYPTTGAAVKEACKKEMPTEFTGEERAYFESKIMDTTMYKTPAEVMAALNMK